MSNTTMSSVVAVAYYFSSITNWFGFFASSIAHDGGCGRPASIDGMLDAFTAVTIIAKKEDRDRLCGIVELVLFETREVSEEHDNRLRRYLEWILLRGNIQRYFSLERRFVDCDIFALFHPDFQKTFIPKFVQRLRDAVAAADFDFMVHFPLFIQAIGGSAVALVKECNITSILQQESFPYLYLRAYKRAGLV